MLRTTYYPRTGCFAGKDRHCNSWETWNSYDESEQHHPVKVYPTSFDDQPERDEENGNPENTPALVSQQCVLVNSEVTMVLALVYAENMEYNFQR